MTDRLTLPSRSPRSHSRIPPRHGARLAPSPSHPFRSRIPGRARSPGRRGSGGIWGRRPGPGTRWEAPRGRPGQDGGVLTAASGARVAAAMAAEAGQELDARVAFRAAFREPGLAYLGAQEAGRTGSGQRGRGPRAWHTKETHSARARQPDSAPGTASGRGRGGRLWGGLGQGLEGLGWGRGPAGRGGLAALGSPPAVGRFPDPCRAPPGPSPSLALSGPRPEARWAAIQPRISCLNFTSCV